jgi:hypothetical protein
MFIVCCKYTNFNYMLYYILGVFYYFVILFGFGEVRGGRYFTTTTLLISDPSPVSPKRALQNKRRKTFILYCRSAAYLIKR